jgi:uncharacterized protein YjbI with pentapeptide repeats
MADLEHLEILERGTQAWNKWRKDNPSIKPNFRWADINGISLGNLYPVHYEEIGEHQPGANLAGADFHWANLGMANLIGADLSGANLCGANLSSAILEEADLSGADLSGTILNGARLAGASFNNALLGSTVLVGVDLSTVKGLETTRHLGPSEIGVQTLYKSQGKIPLAFLRGVGLPDEFITYASSLTTKAIDFYSCFISYSSKDQEFADRLHSDLQAKGVRVWFAPHDMKIGARIRPTIDESIRVYDKLLLVLSELSVSSQWVEQEVETALAKEREQEGKTVLFPIRIDNVVMERRAGWPALLRNTRNVGDFTDWKDHDSYRKAFDRLLRDLQAKA